MANAFYAPMAKATQYAAPDISKLLYEGIGNLPQDYYQGQKSAQELALSQSLPQGLTPYWSRDPRTGQPVFDVYRYANDQARIGGPAQAAPFVNALMGAQYGAQQSQALSGIAGLPSPDGGLPTGWAPPGQSQPPPRSPPQTAGPQSNILPGPQSAAPTSQPREPSGEMDNLAGIATEHYGGSVSASPAIGVVARSMGVRPDETLSPDQIQEARNRFASLSPNGRIAIRPAGAPDTDPASGPQPTFGPSEDVSPVPRATSALERGVNGTPGPAPEPPVGGPGPGVVTPQGIIQNRVTSTPITPAGANVRTAGGPLGQPAAPPAQAPAPVAGAGGRLIDVPLPGVPREVESLRQKAAAAAIEAARAGLNPNQQMGKGMETGASALAKQYADAYESKLKALYEANKLTPEAVNIYRGMGPAVAEQKGRESFAEGQGKEDVAEVKAIRLAGKTARPDLDYLRDASVKMDDKDFYSGPFQDFVKHFKTAEWLIGGQRDKLTPMEMVRKEFANNEMAVIRDLGNSGLGRILFREVEAAQKTVAGMGLSVETNRAMVELAIRLRERAVAIEDHVNQTGRPDYAWANQYMNEHPLITPAERQNPKLIAPPHISKHEDFERLGVQPGEPFRAQDKDGTWRIVIRPRNQQ